MTGMTHDPFETRRIYTIGHSNRDIDELLGLLQGCAVRSLVDVRRIPASRRYPHFNRGELSAVLLRHGILYHHLGKDLGGKLQVSYESYMRTAEFRRGIEVLEDLASSSVTAILCAERDPEECHRRHLADHLTDLGWEVVHLLDPGALADHRPAEGQRRLF